MVASPPTELYPWPGPEICTLCEKPGLRTHLYRDPFIYGSGEDAVELVANVVVHTCALCDISYTGEDADIERTEIVREHLNQ